MLGNHEAKVPNRWRVLGWRAGVGSGEGRDAYLMCSFFMIGSVKVPLKATVTMTMAMVVKKNIWSVLLLVLRMASAKAIAPRSPAIMSTSWWVIGILFLRPRFSRKVSGKMLHARPTSIATYTTSTAVCTGCTSLAQLQLC